MTVSNCLYCDRDDRQLPLILLTFQGVPHWICPEHLPILIHHPEQLTDKLPGMNHTPGV